MFSYIAGGMQAKGIWKQDSEANIWTPRGMRMGSVEGSTNEFNSGTVHLIEPGD